MKKAFLLALASLIVSTFHCTASEQSYVNPQNYLYNAFGYPTFLKLYLPKHNQHFPKHSQGIPFSGQPIYNDERGIYLLAVFKDGYWVCPACGRLNPDYNEYCSNTDCPLSW